jgi:hypothetical protein
MANGLDGLANWSNRRRRITKWDSHDGTALGSTTVRTADDSVRWVMTAPTITAAMRQTTMDPDLPCHDRRSVAL